MRMRYLPVGLSVEGHLRTPLPFRLPFNGCNRRNGSSCPLIVSAWYNRNNVALIETTMSGDSFLGGCL